MVEYYLSYFGAWLIFIFVAVFWGPLSIGTLLFYLFILLLLFPVYHYFADVYKRKGKKYSFTDHLAAYTDYWWWFGMVGSEKDSAPKDRIAPRFTYLLFWSVIFLVSLKDGNRDMSMFGVAGFVLCLFLLYMEYKRALKKRSKK